MRRLLVALALAAAFLAHAQPTSPSYLDFPAAINKAGRQRMLAEFAAKEYLQAAEGVDAPGARGHLVEAVWVFDDQLADLKAFAAAPALKDAVAEVDQAWAELRQILLAAPTRSQATALRRASEAVVQAAERNTAALQAASGLPAGELVNLAGRQRMLSQRIAKDFLLLARRLDETPAGEELAKARAEFAAAHAALRRRPENTPEIEAELAAVEAQWTPLDALLAARRYDRERTQQAVAATDAILSRMERVTALYQRLAAR